MISMSDKLYTIKEVAEIFKVHPLTIRRWEKEGRITFIRPAHGTVRITQSEINKLLNQESEK
ncbi:MAG: helix-turn-helix domain-containing protein [Chloroherpetonaceae bacterium]